MVTRLYSIRDNKLGVYGSIFQDSGTIQAIRQLQVGLTQGPNTVLKQHSADFELVEIASFEDNTGKLEVHETPVHIESIQTLMQQIEASKTNG